MMNKETKILLGILIIVIALCSSPVSAMPPPDVQAKACIVSGGFWIKDHCLCPPFTKYEHLSCWIKTYEDN